MRKCLQLFISEALMDAAGKTRKNKLTSSKHVIKAHYFDLSQCLLSNTTLLHKAVFLWTIKIVIPLCNSCKIVEQSE